VGGADLDRIREAFCQRTYLFTTTGFPKMRKLGLTSQELEDAICRDAPEVLEDYPDDERGPACLVLGWPDLVRPLHVVVGYGGPGVEIEVVTVYEPDRSEWHNSRVRRKR
jgi:hypothetical protein